MIPDLDRDLLVIIAKNIKRPIALEQTVCPSAGHAINIDNVALVNMMKASKVRSILLARVMGDSDSQVMQEICNPLLYKDWVGDEFTLFNSDSSTNKNFDQSIRLHLHYRPHWVEATYHDIISSGWDTLQTKFNLNQFEARVDAASVTKELRALVDQGTKLRLCITQGLTVLPNLRRVSTGGIGGHTPFGHTAPHGRSMGGATFGFRTKTLPHALLDLSTTEHYCQAVAYGPLSLPNKIIKPKTELKTFTHHLKNMATFCINCEDCHVHWSPPIILGAINRYYCSSALAIPYPISPDYQHVLLNYVSAIVGMVTRAGITIAHPITGNPIPYAGSLSDAVVKGTTIEIYNFIRAVRYPKANASIDILLKYQDTMATLPPLSLSFFQDLLNQALPDIWKGKVKLLDKEDAPLCPACGFDLQEEVQYRTSSPQFIRHQRREQG